MKLRKYADVKSLYPYICKYFKFPVGQPVIHVGDACKGKEACLRMDGLIKCLIVPPETLYHLVLHLRCNNKHVFCLCRKCVPTSPEVRNVCVPEMRTVLLPVRG